MIKVTLPDQSVKELKDGATAYDAAEAISPMLAKKAICAKVNGDLFDLHEVLPGDCTFAVVTATNRDGSVNPDALHVLRHSAAHLMAEAIQHLYPGAQFGFGPATEEGFYYDIALPKPISEDDFPAIEKEMQKIVSQNQEIVRENMSRAEALERFKDQKYKSQHINELADDGQQLSVYKQGDYEDLCKGPHMASTKYIKAFKIMSTSACYWRGDKNNDTMTRIYGTAFFEKKDLEDYLKVLEERKQADHKRLGRELGLFMFSDFGPGLPFWLPNGMIVRHELEKFLWDLLTANGYNFLMTPMMLSRELWETSGHWKKYKENMYITKVDGKPYAIKPMNCPGAILVYKNDIHSYRDLPLRYAEFGLDHRHEASGALNGLFRVRSFTQDDAHILLRFDQVGEEVHRLAGLFAYVYKTFGLPFSVELSTRPDKFVGKISTWDKAEAELKHCLEENNIPYEINEGDGAFYGPKLDFKIRDSLNRVWQCGTIQLDMQLPHRFHCIYTDKDGSQKEPVMIHRAIFGSFERFLGIITENFKGAYPTWLSPEQVRILPINNDEAVMKYAANIEKKLKNKSIRVSIDDRNEKLNYKIREAQTKKVPYTIVIGNKEAEAKNLTYRLYGHMDSVSVSESEFVKIIENDIKTKQVTREYKAK